MVKLDVKSTIDATKYPTLAQWDKDMRQSYEDYQKRIDATTYHLQRSQRGIAIFGEWMYPKFFQKDVLELEVLRRKQQLGKIYPQEVNSYKSVNPDIADDLNSTFNAKFMWPVKGAAIGVGLIAAGQLLNLPYSIRLGMFLIPTLADVGLQWGNKAAQFKSLEFLDYLLQYRTARALIEKNASTFTAEKKQAYQQAVNSNKSVQDLYQQFVALVAEQAPSE